MRGGPVALTVKCCYLRRLRCFCSCTRVPSCRLGWPKRDSTIALRSDGAAERAGLDGRSLRAAIVRIRLKWVREAFRNATKANKSGEMSGVEQLQPYSRSLVALAQTQWRRQPTSTVCDPSLDPSPPRFPGRQFYTARFVDGGCCR